MWWYLIIIPTRVARGRHEWNIPPNPKIPESLNGLFSRRAHNPQNTCDGRFVPLIINNVNWTLKGVPKNTIFKNKLSPTHQASAWGSIWRDLKEFLISTKFRGSSSHFRFDHFYIVYFHSALTLQVSLQTNPHADTWWVGLHLFLKKMFFWYTLWS